MLTDIALLMISLGIILLGAAFFTNSVEWLGKKLNLTEGAVGSLLAAVGTAMPETIIPITAILLGTGDAAHDIGIGAILGAPFMLSTLAMCIAGATVYVYKRRRKDTFPKLYPDPEVMKRDLGFFVIFYALAISAAFMPWYWLKAAVALAMVIGYIIFAYRTLTCGKCIGEDCEMEPLYICRKVDGPPTFMVVIQLLLAFGTIVLGAKIFVHAVTDLSVILGVPAFIMALLIAPVATELPEKFNSVIWLSKKKDTLAFGNITGAMVFQGSIIPAIGIMLTPWVLTSAAIISAVLALVSAVVIYIFVSYRNFLDGRFLMVMGGLFYSLFVFAVISGMIH